MKVAINYSHAAADLFESGHIPVDVFKCPAWPELVTEARERHAAYIHFPLGTTRDLDNVIDSERKAPADLDHVARLLDASDTPYVNVHFAPTLHTYPDLPVDTTDTAHTEHIIADAVRSIRALQQYFGRDRIIMENVPDAGNTVMRPAILPETINRVVEQTGCGFLLDISHAAIAADFLGMDTHTYLEALPVQHIAEIHITGVHLIDETHIARLNAMGVEESMYHRLIGRLVDHLPFTERDWDLLEWVMSRIGSGEWRAPWVVSFEYGGVGGIWEMIGDRDVMAEQVPRLHSIVHSTRPTIAD
ncbi:MAG: DUF692 family multinuclear iron-containing protein [Chloroflexota bacterium]